MAYRRVESAERHAFPALDHSMTATLRFFPSDEETEEKDRSAPALVADQPGHAGERIRQKVFPLEE
jgi:hypothetical protein